MAHNNPQRFKQQKYFTILVCSTCTFLDEKAKLFLTFQKKLFSNKCP